MTTYTTIKAKTCKVIPVEECLTQHRLLYCDWEIKNMKMPKIQKGEKRIKMWKLKINKEGSSLKRDCKKTAGAKAVWMGLGNVVMETAREVCGESRGQKHRERKTWYWLSWSLVELAVVELVTG